MITEVAFPQFQEYQEFLTDDGGKFYRDRETSEILRSELREVPEGSYVLTPAKMEANRKYRARQEQKERRKKQLTELGDFVFVSADSDTFDTLPADTMARAVYLGTFLKFGEDSLWETERSQIKRSKLHSTLRLSESASDSFWRKVRGRYFWADADGFVHARRSAFQRGKLQARPDEEYQRLYCAVIRELYEKLDPRQHKKFGYVLKMLPFLNFEYNILCLNPTETNYEEVEPITVADFCGAVGYDRSHAPQLAADFGRMTFDVAGKREVFCKFFGSGRDVTTANVYINPRLVYKGHDFTQVSAIGISFAADAKVVS